MDIATELLTLRASLDDLKLHTRATWEAILEGTPGRSDVDRSLEALIRAQRLLLDAGKKPPRSVATLARDLCPTALEHNDN